MKEARTIILPLVLATLLGPLLAMAAQQLKTPAPRCDFTPESIPDGDTVYAYTLRVVTPTTAVPQWTRFRLDEVYTPEKGEERWSDARDDLRTAVLNRALHVEVLNEKDPWGGLVVKLYQCDRGTVVAKSINEVMREKGWTHSGKGVEK
jgi:hypothetical protein